MPASNDAAVAEFWAFSIDEWDETQTDAGGFITRWEATQGDIAGGDFFAQAVRNWVREDRAFLAQLVARERMAGRSRSILAQMGIAISSGELQQEQEPNQDQLWEDLYDYMDGGTGNITTVNSREFTYGSFAGATTGSGDVLRLTVDENGYDLEGWFPDTYTVTCVRDARQTGSEHEEVFRFQGTDAPQDNLEAGPPGKAIEQEVKSISAVESRRWVLNPSFSTFTGTGIASGSPGNPTTLAGWTTSSGDFLQVRIDLDTTFREEPGVATNASLEFTADDTIFQDLVAVNNARFDIEAPYIVGVRVYRLAGATGNITIRLSDSTLAGGVSRTVAIGTLSAGAWTTIYLLASPAANYWTRNFNAADLTLSIAVDTLAVANIYVDDIVFAPWTRVGQLSDARRGRGGMGTYIAIVGGETAWIEGDSKSATDSEVGAVNQEWFARMHRGYLPHTTGGTEDWLDK